MRLPGLDVQTHAEHHAAGDVSGIAGFFRHLFDSSGFPARWQCGDWQVGLGWLHIISDCAIFFAYAAIPAALATFTLRRRDVPQHTVLWLFVAFILSCGITHLADAAMFYYPAYRLLGLMKLVTALVSLATVVALARVMPMALELPGLARAHRSSQLALSRSQDEEAKLRLARENLESRSAQLTVSERRLRTSMLYASAAAVSWQVSSGRFLWETGLRDLLRAAGEDSGDVLNWARVLGEANRAQLEAAANRAEAASGYLSIDFPLADSSGRSGSIRIRARAQPRTADEPLVMTGLVELTDGR